MKTQEIFDTVVTHLRQQGSKALLAKEQIEDIIKRGGRVKNDSTDCAYRTPDGKKCAAGCLIEDSEYSPAMEGRHILGILTDPGICPKSLRDRLVGSDGDIENGRVLSLLQSCHDQVIVERWEERFQTIASEFGLVYTPPNP